MLIFFALSCLCSAASGCDVATKSTDPVDPDAGWCGDGVCGPGENPSNCPEDCPIVCGDGWCSAPEENHENCPEDCKPCAALDDVTDLINTSELFFGYAMLGRDLSTPDCGELVGAKEVYLSFTPDFSGDLVLSTVHPATNAATVLEVREGDCDGPSIACNDNAWNNTSRSRVILPVQAGKTYFAMVETDDDESGIFALGLHRAGVCEGFGDVEDITSDLLTGKQFSVDTSGGTSSFRGSCVVHYDNPEALFTFTAPLSGEIVATTALSGTDFDVAMYVRREDLENDFTCFSPEAEIACAVDTSRSGFDHVLRFDVLAGRVYHLFIDGSDAGDYGNASMLIGYGAQSPARASLHGCDHAGIQDRFAFFAQNGDNVYLMADTVNTATAADLRMRIRRPDMSELYEADDEVACTYPPPAYSCPEYAFTAQTSGLYFAEIYVGVTQHCYNHNLADYEITVTVNNQHAELIMVKDE